MADFISPLSSLSQVSQTTFTFSSGFILALVLALSHRFFLIIYCLRWENSYYTAWLVCSSFHSWLTFNLTERLLYLLFSLEVRYFFRKFSAINVDSAPKYVHLRLVSQAHMIAGQNIKKKYRMWKIPIKMLKQHAIPNSSLHNLKIYSLNGCRKTGQRWIICVCT